MCAKRWALLSLCLLVASASHGAGETGAAAIGEGQATATSADQALAARIKEALGKEPVLRDATNLSVVAKEGEVTLSGLVGRHGPGRTRSSSCAGCQRGAAGRGQAGAREQG